MKGIILAGGTGTRLFPITKGISKQLMPVYDKPMIYYPLSVLMLAGIKDILLITMAKDLASFESLFGDGSELGIKINYAIQEVPLGVADAFIIGEKFIGKNNVCLILGDNIFYGEGFTNILKNSKIRTEKEKLATVFGYYVDSPEKYGIVEFDNNKKAINISTPSANVFVRGTDFTITTTPETGASLIILLPDEYGNSSGEILVETAMGQVILNQPYQATTAITFNQEPSKPVTLDITLDLIDNMLIVNPPKETEASLQQTEVQGTADYLDFTDLDVDFLAEDFLDNKEELEFTELDINYLDVNFLEDLLKIIDALAIGEEEDQLNQLATGIRIAGTDIGQDKDTQITTIITGQQVSIRRAVGDSFRLDLDGSSSYTLILLQNGVENVVKVNGGSANTITISQGS